MVFGNGVKNIQAAAYNGARTVNVPIFILFDHSKLKLCPNNCLQESGAATNQDLTL